MTIELVTEENIQSAAEVHTLSWKESHKSFCTEEFLELHTVKNRVIKMQKQIKEGTNFYLLKDETPKAVVSVNKNFIENLYVLPTEQKKGYGTMLLHYAESVCTGTPTLSVLNNNDIAIKLYKKCEYEFTGKEIKLTDTLTEMEMKLTKDKIRKED